VPYATVIKRLGDGDHDIKINAITFLNVIYKSCESEERAASLLKMWQAAGIVDHLKALYSIYYNINNHLNTERDF
jgi:hypothetical protein